MHSMGRGEVRRGREREDVRVLVRVVLFAEVPVGLLELFIRGTLIDPEELCRRVRSEISVF